MPKALRLDAIIRKITIICNVILGLVTLPQSAMPHSYTGCPKKGGSGDWNCFNSRLTQNLDKLSFIIKSNDLTV